MNIDQMAHEYAKELLKTTHANHGFLSKVELENISEVSWGLVDLMQAESDKRKPKGLPEVLFEPDWSVAPDWASWWAVDMNGDSHWYSFEPVKNLEINEWTLQNNGEGADNVFDADSSSIYKGDWKDSLRKRP